MVLRYSVGKMLQKSSLARLWRGDYKGPLALADGNEKIDEAGGRPFGVKFKIELFIGENWYESFKMGAFTRPDSMLKAMRPPTVRCPSKTWRAPNH